MKDDLVISQKLLSVVDDKKRPQKIARNEENIAKDADTIVLDE